MPPHPPSLDLAILPPTPPPPPSHLIHQVTEAMNGEEALSILEEESNMPDVILLDVMMPGMSGYDVRASVVHPMGLHALCGVKK